MEKVLWNGRVRFEIHDIELADTGFNVSIIEFLDQTQVKLAQLHVDGRVVSVKVNLQKDKVLEFVVSGVRSINGFRVTVAKAYDTLNQLVDPKRKQPLNYLLRNTSA